MKNALTILLLLAITGALGSCTGSVGVELEEHAFEPGVEVDLGADPWRERRRMDIDQLDQAIQDATDGVRWNGFDTYDDTLGVPDYLNSSAEDLTVSLLFVKFLDDAARSVCRTMTDREDRPLDHATDPPRGIYLPITELQPSEMEPNVQSEVNQALSSLLLRFHGRRVEPASEQLQPWRDLYARNLAAEPDPLRRAWEGVCVALITHPDFYTY